MSSHVTPSKMSGKATKRSHPRNGITFPNGLEIPETAQQDRKYLTSYVHIYNDPRVYKRQRCGDRTSSRFDAYLDSNINVVFNEPIVKRKSILLNPENSKANSTHDHSGTRKSVSFSAKVTVIDIIDLEGGSSSSNYSDDDFIEIEKPTKIKSKKKDEKKDKNLKKEINIDASSKKHVNKTKNKSPNKHGHKNKSPPKTKELFKFKITKPVRKCGRSKLKGKKLKSLQKKFGSKMFKSRVVIRRKNLSKLSLLVEESNIDEIDLNTNEMSVVPDDVINKMTKKLKVVLTPVKMVSCDTSKVNINDEEPMISSDLVESNQSNDISAQVTKSELVESNQSIDTSVQMVNRDLDESNDIFVQMTESELVESNQSIDTSVQMVNRDLDESNDISVQMTESELVESNQSIDTSVQMVNSDLDESNDISVQMTESELVESNQSIDTSVQMVNSDLDKSNDISVQMTESELVESNQSIDTSVQMVNSDLDKSNDISVQIIKCGLAESNQSTDTCVQNTSISEINDIRIDDNQIDLNGTTDNVEMQGIVESSSERISPVPVSKINGESANSRNCNSVMTHQPQTNNKPSLKFMTSSSSPNIFDKITCNMFYNTNKDETATTNGHGQILNTDNDHHIDLVDNSSLNVSFSLKDNILCDASEIAFT